MNAIYSGGIMAGCQESPHFMVYGKTGCGHRFYKAIEALDHAASLIYFDRREDQRRIATLERGDHLRIVYGFSVVEIHPSRGWPKEPQP